MSSERARIDEGHQLKSQLRQRMRHEERDEASRLAHTLKGSAGNLGATAVQQLAAELEAALKGGRDATAIEGLAGSLESQLQRLITALRAALPEEAAAPYQGAVDWAVVRQVLTKLEPLLADSSMQANQLIETQAAMLKAALGPLGAELAQHIAQFCYPEALQTLHKARLECPELAAA